jgi:hypothetical protein
MTIMAKIINDVDKRRNMRTERKAKRLKEHCEETRSFESEDSEVTLSGEIVSSIYVLDPASGP